MTTLSERDWELINAYADGELSATDRTAIARRLTHDPALAAALAEVHAAKAALSLIRPAAAATEPRPRRTGLGRLALVASLAALLFSGVAYHQVRSGDAWQDAPARLDAALSANAYVLSETATPAVISTARIGDVEAFDLRSSHLYLVDVQSSRHDGRDVVAMHYRGRHGCRLTAVAVEAEPGDPAVLPARHKGLGARWTVGGIHYYLLATGMDEGRFAAIARYARAESFSIHQRGKLRLAMREATDKARPCA
jgi:hypothetical protein